MTSSFEDVWVEAAGIPGWLTEQQARTLWDAAASLQAGDTVVEIGSHQGRSTVVLARRARDAGARVVAVDPFVDGRLFGGAATRTKFEANVARAGVQDAVELVARRSTELRPEWRDRIALLYVDGKHDYWTASDDLRWAQFLVPDAPVLVHDSFSSIGVTAALARYAVRDRGLRYERRAGSLALFRTGRAARRDRVKMLAEVPWFVRNVAIKVVLRVLRPLGYRRPDPY